MAPFIPHSENYPLPPNPSTDRPANHEPVRIIIIGSPQGLHLIVGLLHHLGFAEPRAWSKPQIDPNTGRPMQILTKWLHP